MHNLDNLSFSNVTMKCSRLARGSNHPLPDWLKSRMAFCYDHSHSGLRYNDFLWLLANVIYGLDKVGQQDKFAIIEAREHSLMTSRNGGRRGFDNFYGALSKTRITVWQRGREGWEGGGSENFRICMTSFMNSPLGDVGWIFQVFSDKCKRTKSVPGILLLLYSSLRP